MAVWSASTSEKPITWQSPRRVSWQARLNEGGRLTSFGQRHRLLRSLVALCSIHWSQRNQMLIRRTREQTL